MKRRQFLRDSALAGGAAAGLRPAVAGRTAPREDGDPSLPPATPPVPGKLPDLEPARWIWYPSGRCLQNTFVLFRRDLVLAAAPKRATGWICADSRYLLRVNGRRVQWGPPPSDPRWMEADPVDLTALLNQGRNVLATTVLYYGQGDGTWPCGKPGFLLRLEIESADGRVETVVSDPSWRAHLCRAWQPGHYKRWYLRALQEEFDARLYPRGWEKPGFRPGPDWLPAMSLAGSPNKPSVCTDYNEYQTDIGADPSAAELRPRSIPLLSETMVPVKRLTESYGLEWKRSPEEYFECLAPDAFRATPGAQVTETAPGCWTVAPDVRGTALTFEFEEQVVGWPRFTVEAPAGTKIELLVHEAHQPGGPVLLNTHFNSWTRFVCAEGENAFETFDFESLRWLQLHIHGTSGEVRLRDLGVRRREFPWPHTARVRIGEPALQRLMDANLNTLRNSSQETCVDGMARERQQYSGDGAHQVKALYYAYGETRLPARFLATFGQGMTKDGYFLDCWPAWDRLARLMERQLDLTGWGPILDHGVEFIFDGWSHYLYTGDLEAVRETYPRLLKFARYLKSIQGPDGLLPVESIGIPSVWIDHIAFKQQRHKQCAFNLFAAAALEHGLAPLARAFGDAESAAAGESLGHGILEAAVKTFWSAERELFVANLPWLKEEKAVRLCDRSLATAVLYDQCSGGRTQEAVRVLAECPPEMGLSYPANAGWRLWALGKAGRADVIVDDFRRRWATMDSVRLNNTLQEDWTAIPDSGQQWSHCAVVPLYVLYMSLLGLRPLEPGYARYELRPQLADLGPLDILAQTPKGPLSFKSEGKPGGRMIVMETPCGGEGEIVLPIGESVKLELLPGPAPEGCVRCRLPAGARVGLRLKSV
jgi:alpha-L-rhamnosidase